MLSALYNSRTCPFGRGAESDCRKRRPRQRDHCSTTTEDVTRYVTTFGYQFRENKSVHCIQKLLHSLGTASDYRKPCNYHTLGQPSSRPIDRSCRVGKTMVFYEPGKTDHGLPRDPFKVKSSLCSTLIVSRRSNKCSRPASFLGRLAG